MKKKFFMLLIVLLFITFPTIAGAEKSKWKSSDYNFSAVQNVLVTEIETPSSSNYDYIADRFFQKKLESALRQAFEKRQVKMFTIADIDRGSGPTQEDYLTIKPTVHALGKWSEQKEAYYETRTVYKKIVVKHKYAKDKIITVPTDETLYHPARTVWHAVANLEFIVSSAGGEDVYMVVDERERPEETDTSGMLTRICNDLADELTHN